MFPKVQLTQASEPSIHTAYLGIKVDDVKVEQDPKDKLTAIFREIESLAKGSLADHTMTVDFTMKQVTLHTADGKDLHVQTTAKIARLIEEGNTILQPLLKAQQLAVAENLDHRSLSETPFAPDKTSLYTPPTGTPSERIQAAYQLLEPLISQATQEEQAQFERKKKILEVAANSLETSLTTSPTNLNDSRTLVTRRETALQEAKEALDKARADAIRAGQNPDNNQETSDRKLALEAAKAACEDRDYLDAKEALIAEETRLALKQDLESTDYFLLLAGLLFTDDKGNPNASVDEIAKKLKNLEKPLRKSRSMKQGLKLAITSFSSGYTEERLKDLAIAIAAARETSRLKRMSLALEHYGELRQDSLAATTLMAITHSAIKLPSSLSSQTIRECSIDDRISDSLLNTVVGEIKPQPQPVTTTAAAAPAAADAGASAPAGASAADADADAKEDN